MKSRIAPTPSGFLHLGNAANFLLTHLLVEAGGGQLLLRIDDLDAARSRPEYVAHIFSVLRALKITVHEGPVSPRDLQAHWSQRLRLDGYRKLLDRLVVTGRVYACDCSRKTVAAHSTNGLYSGYCRHRQLPLEQEGVSWRIDTSGQEAVTIPGFVPGKTMEVDLEKEMGDFVIRKKDGMPAYQLCSLADDLNFGIDLIVRGKDLLLSTAAQLYLAGLAQESDWLERLRTIHHPLIVDAGGQKLSKSAGALALELAADGQVKLSRKMVMDLLVHWMKEMDPVLTNQLKPVLPME